MRHRAQAGQPDGSYRPGSIAGVGGGIAGPSKTVVGAVPAGSSMKLESSDDRRPDHKAR